MISREEYIQLKAFARQDGLLIGLLWVITFGCFVGSMTTPIMQIGFIIGIAATPFVMFFYLRRFRDDVLEGYISYGRAVMFCAFTLIYASLIIAMATLVYFYFFDNGAMINTLHNNIALPELRNNFKQAGINPEELEKQIEEIAKLRPIDFAFNMLFNSVILSSLLALILGAIGMRKRKEYN